MKSVLISIKPKYVELIAIGEKTIEVRKTRPKLEKPFKCYIYCTNGNGTLNDTLMSGDRRFVLNQKVVGEFVCNEIEPLTEYDLLYNGHYVEENTRVSQKELLKYKGKNNFLYGWHISNLKIYDKPKELGEFRVPCKFAYSSYEKGICYEDCIQGKLEDCRNFCLPITRPFQSWGYIEKGE